MAIGLPEAVRVFTPFTGPDSNPGAEPLPGGGELAIDVGTQSCWASVTFTGAPTHSYDGPYGVRNFYRVMTQWIDGANHIEILINSDSLVVTKVRTGIREVLCTRSLFPSSWSGGNAGTYYIQSSYARGQVFVSKAGQYHHIALGPIYGEGSIPADGHFPAGTHIVADNGSTTGTTVIDAYLGYVEQAGYDDGWRPYATEELGNSSYMLDYTYLPWVIDGGHLRDCFSGDYDQSFGGGGLLVDGQSTFGRLDVDVYGEHAKSGYSWYVIAGSMAGPEGREWSGVSALVVSPVGYSHMTRYGYQPGANAPDVPVFADGDTFSAILTGQATTDFTSRRLQLLHNGVVYWETDVLVNTEGFDDGTYVGVWAQNYGGQPRGYGGPDSEWGVNNFRWTSLPVIPTPPPPTAVLHVTPASGVTPLTVLVNPGDSTNASHSQLSGPGFETRYNTLDPFSVTYTAAGVQHLTLDVADDYGRPASTSADVTVTVPPPPPPPDVYGWSVGRVR